MTAQNDYASADAADDGAIVPPQLPRYRQDALPTDIGADHQISTEQLAAYIRHIADSAPTPSPAQLERLANLLRDPGSPNTSQ